MVNSAMVGLGQNVLWSLGYAYILAKSEFSIPLCPEITVGLKWEQIKVLLD